MFDLSPYNTFGLKVKSKDGLIVNDVADLRRVHSENIIVLGQGSDVLFTDDFDGTVLINNIKSLNIDFVDGKYIVKVGGGVNFDQLIVSLIEKRIFGLENLSYIPGTVGASPVQNIGAYGIEIGDYIKEVTAYDLQRHIIQTFSKEECEFGYRTSYFKTHKSRRLFITSVTFELSSEFKPKLVYQGLKDENFVNAQELRDKVVELRRTKLPDPRLVGNAGSFFKNPIVSKEFAEKLKKEYETLHVYPYDENNCKLPAGYLIEHAGCKGITHGNVGTWEHQALVIVNRGNAKPHEVVALAKYIIAEVYRKFGVNLEPEVRTYGRTGEVSWDTL